MPWTRQFKDEILNIFSEKEEIMKLLNQSITIDMCQDTNVLTLLGDRLLLWPTYDIRYQGFSSDGKLLTDIAQGMETNVVRKDLATGTITLAVDVQTNLNEFEKYNLLVEQHNDQWERNGRPTQVIDPVHGDIFEVKDQYLDPAFISSRCCPAPDCKVNDYEQSGKLANMKPTIQRQTYVTVTYQVSLSNSEFQLGYAAYDKNQKVLYYNEQYHNDLAILIRKSIQEIWGNPYLSRPSGPLLKGISLLMQGKKLSICERENKVPNFLSYIDSKDLKKNTRKIERAQKVYEFSNKFFGYGVPIVSFLMVIVIFSQLVSGINNENLNGLLILLEITAVIGAVIVSRYLSRSMERNASIMDARKSLP